VGAPRRAILAQFLIETVLISASGGLAGILVGFAMARGINLFAGWETALSPLATLSHLTTHPLRLGGGEGGNDSRCRLNA